MFSLGTAAWLLLLLELNGEYLAFCSAGQPTSGIAA